MVQWKGSTKKLGKVSQSLISEFKPEEIVETTRKLQGTLKEVHKKVQQVSRNERRQRKDFKLSLPNFKLGDWELNKLKEIQADAQVN